MSAARLHMGSESTVEAENVDDEAVMAGEEGRAEAAAEAAAKAAEVVWSVSECESVSDPAVVAADCVADEARLLLVVHVGVLLPLLKSSSSSISSLSLQ